MPIPIINPQASVPGGLRIGARFEFRLALTSLSTAATSWQSLDPLPTGVTLNTTTGLISGTPTVGGVWSARITATNASGASTAVTVSFGVEDVRVGVMGMAELMFDLDTLQVWNPAEPTAYAPIKAVQGDKKPISIGVLKNGVLQDKVVAHIRLRLLNDEDSQPFLVTTGAWEKIGTGVSTRYVALLDFSVAGIASMVADWDSARSIGGYPWAQLEFTFLEAPPASTVAALAPITSKTFPAFIQGEFT